MDIHELEKVELELMCRVLVEDSQWLDLFQNRVLQKIDDGKPCRITLLTDQENSRDQLKETCLKQSCPMSGNTYDSSGLSCRTPCPYFIESLPAPEFISGVKSLVTSESLRLLQNATIKSSKASNGVQVQQRADLGSWIFEDCSKCSKKPKSDAASSSPSWSVQQYHFKTPRWFGLRNMYHK